MEEKNKKKVLVVDDDDNLRFILTDKLGASGFEVEGAANGQEGLAKAFSWKPDVIILDILMPVMSGWDMLDTLRLDEWGKKAKVIMLTGVEDPVAVAKAIEDGSFAYLIKTDHRMGDLVERITEMLK